ncbi:uncharacterized protein K441DRAFT_269155 [Cenococcum geophilum 1.58]|uniref:uncharacterized protein n=1 Tax=Cenococcum geophilum 1.58 TaxID=794803 RepID=UPI00358DE923|nr:hypothetical protein K441DRAFT_269155 [Cenococcum geophilum 1.58]
MRGFAIDSKSPGDWVPGSLEPTKLHEGAYTTLRTLSISKPSTFYIHGPDPALSPRDLAAHHRLAAQGRPLSLPWPVELQPRRRRSHPHLARAKRPGAPDNLPGQPLRLRAPLAEDPLPDSPQARHVLLRLLASSRAAFWRARLLPSSRPLKLAVAPLSIWPTQRAGRAASACTARCTASGRPWSRRCGVGRRLRVRRAAVVPSSWRIAGFANMRG